MKIHRLIVIASLFSAPLAAAAPGPNIVFRGAAMTRVQLTGDRAIAVDPGGKPMFSGTASFLFAIAKNPAQRVQEWDPTLNLVRISTGNGLAIWLRCADLRAMPVACTGMRIRSLPDGKVEVGAPFGLTRLLRREDSDLLGARAMPVCPGDPRCPPRPK